MSASTNDIENVISAAQVRAARGLLNWSRDRLVDVSSVPKRTLVRFEEEAVSPQRRTVDAIRTALETAGVQFIEQNGGGPGVRLRSAP